MKRLSMVLALAVWTAGGSASCYADDSLFGCLHNCLFGKSSSCGDTCGCGESCGCGDSCGSGSSCGCPNTGGCCDSCNSGGCGPCGPGGICDCIVSDCPLCQGARNSGLFQRYCGANCGDGCDDCGMRNDYDCSACRLRGRCYGYGVANGGGCGGCGCGPRVYGGCGSPQYGSGCCAGPGCCASGDQHYTFNPGPPVGQTAYPYYTVRGPRDFLDKNPAPIGPY